MFGILGKSLATGVVTTEYPAAPAELSRHARGRPEVDWVSLKDARRAAAVCPTGAISCDDRDSRRTVSLDLGKCIFCGLCAETDPAVRMTQVSECAVRRRSDLLTVVSYGLKADGTQAQLISPMAAAWSERTRNPSGAGASVETLGRQIQERARKMFGRSLHIREVDAGSCNGCEIEIVNLNSPVYDLERFGIHFVASPRHADLLLVTGPVTRNMELALRKTYDATPDPRLVVAVGACGCSGGMFGVNYATCGAVDAVIPVDVFVPGCPPNPYALLHGILLAMGRME
ncbi:MAG TPA: NADH-quinone oxidoreductase subunit NuoB [Verrucomicrobiae bacterium]